jgi:DNA topoisomerase-2
VSSSSARNRSLTARARRRRTLKVSLNGEKLSVKSFQDYVNLYLRSEEDEKAAPRVFEKINDRYAGTLHAASCRGSTRGA